MVYKDTVQEQFAVDKAWEQLSQRLDNEGLLPKTGVDKTLRNRHSAYRKLYIAATLAACLFLGWYFMHNTYNSDIIMRITYNEVPATTLVTVLEDGSVAYLSEQTSLKYPEHFAGDKREVFLHGEAFFEIKKQSDRPFFIDTELAGIEITGTSFKIKSDTNGSFLLSVREGEVRVHRKKPNQTLSVKAGETLLFDTEQLQLIKHETGFNEYFKRILFKDERLANIVTVINLHSDSIQLKVAPDLEHRITFTYLEHSDIAEIAEAICLALNLQHTRQGNIVYISKQQ